MSKIEFKPETTPNGDVVLVASVGAELLSVAKNAVPNSKGTNFYPCTIKFETTSGTMKSVTALLYQGNAEYGVEIGVTYLTKIIATGERDPLFVMSHLPRGSQATLDDLGLSLEDFKAIAPMPDLGKVSTKK